MPQPSLTPTPGERLLIDRRRRGLSKTARARELGVGVKQYRRWENDEEKYTKAFLFEDFARLELHEELYLRRRRSGLSRAQVAKKVGVTPQWITLMEQGKAPVDRLAEFWSNH